ncbi:sushi, von Willebrand factor type A, EGF and pentraxin domain-containing protein 1 [Trichonephila clavipes]|nr:sushi, von Willebrand factor type A, EGF and pentraxin domain-containing protein 1 [Trichonephila clavipes]
MTMSRTGFSSSETAASAPITNLCTLPERLHNTLLYRGSTFIEPKNADILMATAAIRREKLPSGGSNRYFPNGTEVLFKCLSAYSGKKTTWKIVCQDGVWVGRPHNCEPRIHPGPVDHNRNKSCIFRRPNPDVVAFVNDKKVKVDSAKFPAGTEVVYRCVDIGKYSFEGSARRRCVGGQWTGTEPLCLGLSQEYDYALEKAPTILFRHQVGQIAQSNDGKLVVYPGTVLHLECLWIRKYGTPHWEVSHKNRKYPEELRNECIKPNFLVNELFSYVRTYLNARFRTQWVGHGEPVPCPPQSFNLSNLDYFLWGHLKNLIHETPLGSDEDLVALISEAAARVRKIPGIFKGWTIEPGRDSQLEYRLTIYHAKTEDSGMFTCVTPMGHQHAVEIVVSDNLVALHFKYDQARRRFVEWAQNKIAVVPDFHKRILFSDEAHFWLNGYVNKQNCRIWSEANPQVYVETPLHPEKLTVWCALWAGGILQKR